MMIWIGAVVFAQAAPPTASTPAGSELPRCWSRWGWRADTDRHFSAPTAPASDLATYNISLNRSVCGKICNDIII